MLKINLENNVLTIESPNREKVRVLQRPDVGAVGNEHIRIITYLGGTKIEPFTAHYSDIKINGVTFINIDDALYELSKIVAVFKQGNGDVGGVSPDIRPRIWRTSNEANNITLLHNYTTGYNAISYFIINKNNVYDFTTNWDVATDVRSGDFIYGYDTNRMYVIVGFQGVNELILSQIQPTPLIFEKTVTSDTLIPVPFVYYEYKNPLTSLTIQEIKKSTLPSYVYFKPESATMNFTITTPAELMTNDVKFDTRKTYEITILMGKVSIAEFKAI